jgi:hypothetical protein
MRVSLAKSDPTEVGFAAHIFGMHHLPGGNKYHQMGYRAIKRTMIVHSNSGVLLKA